MTKKWTTLVEEQTEKANDSIARVLQQEVAEASKAAPHKNKYLAVGMALVGLVLIGVGVWPMADSLFKADITDNSSNIFTNAPETVENVPVKDPEIVEMENPTPNPLDTISGDTDATLLPIDSSTVDGGSPGLPSLPDLATLPDLNPDNVGTLPVALPEIDEPTTTLPDMVNDSDPSDLSDEFVGTDNSNEPVIETYPQNRHTGTIDPKVVVFGEKANAAENLHSAAHEMNRSGPAEWVALLFAVPAAFFLRRKKLFA